MKNFKIDFADPQLPKPITDLPPLPNDGPLKSGSLELDKYRPSPTTIQGNDLETYLDQNKITTRNVPYELADPNIAKTSNLFKALGAPNSAFAKP